MSSSSYQPRSESSSSALSGVFRKPDDKLGLLQTTVDCVRYETMPPNLSCRTTFGKRFTVSGLWDITEDYVPPVPNTFVNEGVSTRSGVLLWLPWRGIDNFKRFGLVPKGAKRVISNRTWTWTKETAIPYGTDQGQVKVSPDASKDFSFTRLVSAEIGIASTAIAIGSTVITGQVAWSVVQDTRDVSQTDQGAFVADNIVQQSMCGKDAAVNQQLADGLHMILGSDIDLDFTVPDRNNFFSRNAGVEKFILIGDGGFTNSAAAGSGYQSSQFGWHISPWGVHYVDTQVALDAAWTQLESANINIFGKVRFVAYLELANTHVAPFPPQADANALIRVHFQDTYASCGKDGSVTYSQGPRTSHDLPIVFGQDNTVTQRQVEHVVQNRTDLYGTDSIYIGTAIYYYYVNPTTVAMDLKVSNFHVHMFADDIYTKGELGPARIARYDGVGVGQQMSVSGNLLVECVPEGSIAPYVTSSDKAIPKTLSINMYPFLASVYNGQTAFRRNWPEQMYREFTHHVVPELSLENVVSLGGSELQNAAVAAGLFSDLGGALGGIFGGTGRDIGHAIGSTADVGMHFFGAQGQYGASGQYGAGGQFGAPQFGASGQFSGGKRPYGY